MIGLSLYYLILILELLFAIGFCAITISFIYSSIKGSPYVPTRIREIDLILKTANLKPKQKFVELGCGDGRVSRLAVHKYNVDAIGVDINPFLIWYARFLSKLKFVKNAKFYRQDIFDFDLTSVDVIYLFLMPKLIQNLLPKLEKELKTKALVISHGFRIEGWQNRIITKIDHNPFPTYFYRK